MLSSRSEKAGQGVSEFELLQLLKSIDATIIMAGEVFLYAITCVANIPKEIPNLVAYLLLAG